MRPCKYGERINGKCPPKPKSKTQRACKYGTRVNGKCPPKPRATQTQKKRKPCKYGERINGKCPPKPKMIDIEVIVYENGKQKTFDQMDKYEYQSVFDEVQSMLDGDVDIKIVDIGEEGEGMGVKNVEYRNNKIGNGNRKYFLMVNIPVKLGNYGDDEWGKVEFMFVRRV